MRNDIIISDFDETITTRDTTSLVASLPYKVKQGLSPPWSYFKDKYMDACVEYKKENANCIQNRKLPLLPFLDVSRNHGFRSAFNAEFVYQSDSKFVELKSISEIEEYNLFKGITHHQVQEYASNLLNEEDPLIRPGFMNFISSNVKPENFYIVSVNWSKEFIYSILRYANIDPSHIFCDHLLSSGSEYTGIFSKELMTGCDKANILDTILLSRSNDLDLLSKNTRVWYIGDSETDILPLLHPSVNGAILINPLHELKKYLTISRDVLGASASVVESFMNVDREYIKVVDKSATTSVYFVKSWDAFDKLLNEPYMMEAPMNEG
ncbi:Cto1p NDAI_0D01200 [Naumovozyma dairenensis CBS 421]|uniref:Haloacid dehalogenase-like hydrolase n=1 Tax=Naumovozyma dairenensis (strain ATCC 10597 / BCRC 20456 / CBS 421 / NBRC 0211 / NRRL Y-12639) TaxID=1071378 RepID=G0W9H2_NAUDC|nr:hypothetical protein NDAI_0D01200 [Naumovozyma dairenensis CBS 421]CCD24433.1 hypothetical protein NDAI_0D01200 [Naumovozyma dairenensis CBS 421]